MKPPVNGDANGPTNTAIANMAIATPRARLLYMSANVAGTIAKGAAAKTPAKKRVSMIVCRSLAVAVPIVKML